jgi:hypothetical protein
MRFFTSTFFVVSASPSLTRASKAKSFETMVDTSMVWREQIKHPDPERAVRFGFVMIALVLRELILFRRTRIFADLVPLDEDILTEELPRMFLRYLGVEADEVRLSGSGVSRKQRNVPGKYGSRTSSS